MATTPVIRPSRPGRWRNRVFGLVAGVGLAGVVALAGSAGWVYSASRGRLYDEASAPTRDVALVLGAGMQAPGRPSPFLAARLDLAARLLRDGKVRVLLVSGDNSTEHYDEPTGMRDYLVRHGVPADRIVLDYAGFDTYDSCSRARRIFGVERLAVVSQAYHLPRALAVCSALGVDAIGVGDESMREYAPGVWQSGAARELPAGVKAAFDVLSRRDPMLGPPEPGVRDALRRAGVTG